jgi:hypothetical protein
LDTTYQAAGSIVAYAAAQPTGLKKGMRLIVVGATSDTQLDTMVEIGTATLAEDVVRVLQCTRVCACMCARLAFVCFIACPAHHVLLVVCTLAQYTIGFHC